MEIGFRMTADEKEQTVLSPESIAADVCEETPIRSVVTVLFENGKMYPYYNDRFCLHCGDYVYVDGKLAGKLGQVIEYTEAFCINLKYYKRVIQKVTRNISGTFQKFGGYLFSKDITALTPEQIQPWFYPPQNDGEKDELVYGNGFTVEISNTSEQNELETKSQYKNGIDSYYDGVIQYLSYDGKNGYAIVKTENEPTDYATVTFRLENGKIHTAFCTCIAPGFCSHLISVIYGISQWTQNETLQIGNDEFIAIQSTVFEKFIAPKTTITVTV